MSKRFCWGKSFLKPIESIVWVVKSKFENLVRQLLYDPHTKAYENGLTPLFHPSWECKNFVPHACCYIYYEAIPEKVFHLIIWFDMAIHKKKKIRN